MGLPADRFQHCCFRKTLKRLGRVGRGWVGRTKCEEGVGGRVGGGVWWGFGVGSERRRSPPGVRGWLLVANARWGYPAPREGKQCCLRDFARRYPLAESERSFRKQRG